MKDDGLAGADAVVPVFLETSSIKTCIGWRCNLTCQCWSDSGGRKADWSDPAMETMRS